MRRRRRTSARAGSGFPSAEQRCVGPDRLRQFCGHPESLPDRTDGPDQGITVNVDRGAHGVSGMEGEETSGGRRRIVGGEPHPVVGAPGGDVIGASRVRHLAEISRLDGEVNEVERGTGPVPQDPRREVASIRRYLTFLLVPVAGIADLNRVAQRVREDERPTVAFTPLTQKGLPPSSWSPRHGRPQMDRDHCRVIDAGPAIAIQHYEPSFRRRALAGASSHRDQCDAGGQQGGSRPAGHRSAPPRRDQWMPSVVRYTDRSPMPQPWLGSTNEMGSPPRPPGAGNDGRQVRPPSAV